MCTARPLFMFMAFAALACARSEKPAPESARTDPQGVSTNQAQTPDASIADELELAAQKLDAEFAADVALAGADAQTATQPIAGAFVSALDGINDAHVVVPAECRQKLCRITIEASDRNSIAVIYGALTGRPGPGQRKSGPLLNNPLTVARRTQGADGKLTAMFYIRR